MVKIGSRILIALAVLYVGAATFLYAFQSNFIFAAPDGVHAPAEGYDAVALRTADGLDLTAHWRAPQPGQPTVGHFHGNAGSLKGAAVENSAFAERGYGVLLVEYRGYGGNPGTASERGFTLDGRAAMDFLDAQAVPELATVIKGHSLGAGTAMNVALEYRPGAIILVAPFSSVPDLSGWRMPWLDLLPLDLLVRDQFDNLAKAPRVGVPTFVQHGSGDEAIPMMHGQLVAKALTDGTFDRVEGAGHAVSFAASAQERQLEWLGTLGL